MSLTPIKNLVRKLKSRDRIDVVPEVGGVRYDFVFDPQYYLKVADGVATVEDGLRHYEAGGYKLYAPNPFIHLDILKILYPDSTVENYLYAGFGKHSQVPNLFGPLLNLNYFSWKNNCAPEDAVYLFLTKLRDGIWADFSPLVPEEDFIRSGEETLYQWVAKLFDPRQSLGNSALTFFSPSFYRKTCRGLVFENELVDYLLYGSFNGGCPHPLCDLRFAAVSGSVPTPPFAFGDVWSDALGTWPEFAPPMSPFFDANEYYRRLVGAPVEAEEGEMENDGEEPSRGAAKPAKPAEQVEKPTGIHPLIRFTHLPIDLELSPQCLQDCLKYASGRYPVTALGEKILGSQLIEIIGDYLLSTSSECADVKVSVCILHYNKVAHTYFSAVSAALNSDSRTEIIVFDNGSEAWQAELLLHLFRRHPKIRFVRSTQNLFFGEGNNVAKDMARGEYLYFLNNDAYVGPGTIGHLVAHMDAYPDAAACGVPFLFPDGSVQEYGGVVTGSGQQIQDYKHTPLRDHMRNAPSQGIVSTAYISSASFCVRRSVLGDVGGYDYIYEPLYFEDTDLCKRICAAGYRIDLLYDHYVVHVENATTRGFLGRRFLDQINRNREVFRSRWQYTPALHKPRSIADYTAAFEATYADRPDALVYTPYRVNIGGGERYMLSIVSALSRTYNVSLCTDSLLSRDRLAFVMSDLGISLFPDSSLRLVTMDRLHRQRPPDLMIVMGNELVPPIDLFGKTNIYHCQFPFPGNYRDSYQFDRIDGVDFYLCNSRYTAGHVAQKLHDMGRAKQTHILYPPVPVPTAPTKDFSTLATAPNLISVGRFERGGHSKNQHVTAQIFADVKRTLPGAELHLVGGFNGHKAQADHIRSIRDVSPDIHIATNAPRDELDARLARAHIYIHACGYASNLAAMPERQEHFGISVVEAMAFGCIPLVYDAGGPKEIVETTGCGFTYRTVEECAALVRRLSHMPVAELDALSGAAIHAASRYSDEKFVENLLALF